MMKRIFSLILCLICLALTLSGCEDKKSNVTLGNVLILGDSYSTFEGHIPEGYKSYYKKSSSHLGVTSHKKTWWYKLTSRTNSKLLLNSSYSGSTICHTGYDGADYAEISFAARMESLAKSGYFAVNRVETLIILGVLNDYWAESPRGDIKYENFTESDLYSVYPAFAYILSLAKEHLPGARIVFVSEEYLPSDIKADMREICSHFGADVIEIHDIS